MFRSSPASLLVLLLSALAWHVYAEPLAMRQAMVRQEWAESQLEGMLSSLQDTGALGVSGWARFSADKRPAAQNPETFWFMQKVDHTGLNDTLFKQRIYINTNEYIAGGPIYIFNSGETPASPSYLYGGQPFQLAKETGGMLVIMEHRYYGKSYPVSDMSGASMKYLTVENSLDDIANFIRNAPAFIRDNTGVEIPPSSKWVATGGSYSAMLAAWARMMYPELIHAAYASSAPVLAEIDFYQYDQVVGEALPCASKIADAIETLDQILDSKNRTLIDSWKRASGLDQVQDDIDFAGAFIDQMSNVVQYYVPPASGSNAPDSITSLCSWFGRQQYIPLQNLADMTSAYIRSNSIDTVSAYSSQVGAGNTNLGQDGRAWYYQTCTQFGYWQTAPRPPLRRLRSKYLTAEWQKTPCSAFFGPTVTGDANVDAINAKFGGLKPSVTRVVFVNGLHDPWSRLSIVSETRYGRRLVNTRDNSVITMPLASHVTDFYVGANRTDFGVNVAREKILEAIKLFLAED